MKATLLFLLLLGTPIFANGFEPPTEHSIGLWYDSQTVTGTGCTGVEFGLSMVPNPSGIVVANCATITTAAASPYYVDEERTYETTVMLDSSTIQFNCTLDRIDRFYTSSGVYREHLEFACIDAQPAVENTKVATRASAR